MERDDRITGEKIDLPELAEGDSQPVAPFPLDRMAAQLAAADDRKAQQLLGDWQAGAISPVRVHAAILLARDIGLQSAPAEAATVTVLGRFDRMQSAWVHMLEEHWLGRIKALELRLVEQGQANLLQEARVHWLKAGYVELYNYHYEMPLLAQVNVVAVRDQGLSVTCTPDLALLIAAGDQRRTAHLRLAGTSLSLRLVVEGTSSRSIHFREDGIMGIEREKRLHIRVQCKEPVMLKLRHEKGPKWNASIHDFSAFGLGISSHEALPWPVGQELICLFEMGGKPIDVRGTIRWKVAVNSLTRMGIELPREHPFVHRLQMAVADRQQEIMQELKGEGPPNCLLDVPHEARLF